MLFADAVVLEIGASIFLAGAALVAGSILIGFCAAGVMIRKSVDGLGARLERADEQHQASHQRQHNEHAEISKTLAVMSVRQSSHSPL